MQRCTAGPCPSSLTLTLSLSPGLSKRNGQRPSGNCGRRRTAWDGRDGSGLHDDGLFIFVDRIQCESHLTWLSRGCALMTTKAYTSSTLQCPRTGIRHYLCRGRVHCIPQHKLSFSPFSLFIFCFSFSLRGRFCACTDNGLPHSITLLERAQGLHAQQAITRK